MTIGFGPGLNRGSRWFMLLGVISNSLLRRRSMGRCGLDRARFGT